MVSDTSDKDARTDSERPLEAAPSLRHRLTALAQKLSSRNSLAIVLAALVVAHVIGFAYRAIRGDAQQTCAEEEIPLGDFQFVATEPAPGQVAEAHFALHLALVTEVDRPARQRLKSHACRVEQDIEQLLRHAHGGDFDDPALADLKTQLQEQIDLTLGLRAIADVIITNLNVKRTSEALPPTLETADALPWVEPPAG